MLYAQLEAACASSVTGTSVKTQGTNMTPVGLGLEVPGMAISSAVAAPNWLEATPTDECTRVSTSSGLRVAALPFTPIMSETSHITSVGRLLTLPPVPSQSTGASFLGNVLQDSTPAVLPRSQTATTAESP